MYKFLLSQTQVGRGSDGSPMSGLFGLDWGEIIASLLALAGTGIAGWWAWKSKRVDTDETRKSQFHDMLLEECGRLRNLTMSLQMEVTKLQADMEILRGKLKFYEENALASHSREMLAKALDSCQKPIYIHSPETNQWYLNDEFCEAFQVDRPSFWTPVNIYARYATEDVMRYHADDISVITLNTSEVFVEKWNASALDPNSENKSFWSVRKSPFVINETPYIVAEFLNKIESA